MKATTSILFYLIWSVGSSVFGQQYYLRGEVKDESGNALQNVVILQPRTGYIYKSGTTGTFGITTNALIDTFQFSLTGYKPERVVANASDFLSVRLKLMPAAANSARPYKLLSLTKGMFKEDHRKWFAGDETYVSIVENHFVNAQKYPSTGVSLNVDRASYSNIRRFITQSSIVPPDAVRVEEMLNYFNLNYTQPKEKDLFAIQTKLTNCPWNSNNQLFYINLSARKLNLDTLPPSNLVFLIDVSGSMDMTNRLPLLKSAFRMLVNNLREKDSVAIVVYGGVTGIMLNSTSGAEKEKIYKAIDELTPGGTTPGESGVKLAYSVAKKHFIPGGNNRVILATDGDFNVGLRTETELDELISQHRQSGIYLTCLGVGMGNYKDSKIQTLARKGNGNFAYLDNFSEAEKVLLKEFTQTLYAVADDAYLNVEFNPHYVKQYKLIGFDNKAGALSDTLAAIEGGEIGSGYSMMGIFELEPMPRTDTITIEKLAQLKLRYNLPHDTITREFVHNSYYNFEPFEKLEQCYRFSATVAMFGSLLRAASLAKVLNWNELVLLANTTANLNDINQSEFVTLVQQAKLLYSKKKKRGSSE
ncbi:MAG TPA: von Willebrand factor type A domain-containing protein [Chitinophagaceae bacterium]|nr:von Willebrand factor type A domain-containing protein [Chitinophagaceae bacterium]